MNKNKFCSFVTSLNTKQIKRASFYYHLLRMNILILINYINKKEKRKDQEKRSFFGKKNLLGLYLRTSIVCGETEKRECFYFISVFYFQSVAGNYFHFTSHPSSGVHTENDCEFRCRMFIIVSEIPHLTCITTFLSLVVSFFTLRHRWPHLTVETFSPPKISPGRKHFLTYKDILTRGPTKRIRRTKIPFPRKNDAHGRNRHRHRHQHL